MSMLKVIEMLAESDKSWENAAQVAVANASNISFVLGADDPLMKITKSRPRCRFL